MQYLRNALSDFYPVFFYLFVFSSSVTYVKTEKMTFTPPSGLNILKYEMGLEGEALNWFRSFLCGRCQNVRVEGYESVEILIKFGVPPRSVLGPVLFNIYIRSLYNTVHNLNFNIHLFMALLRTIRYSNLSTWDSNSMCWHTNFPNCSTRLQIG